MPAADPAEASKEIAATPATVLVVDDDADTRASLAEVLEEQGYKVVVVEDGQKAFDYLAERPSPDCIVLDLWMPNMDGWTFASEVLTGSLPTVPMLVVTAAAAGFAYPVPPRYVLRKPISPSRMLMLVAELLETRTMGAIE
jgi:CheY-like chemotaxis protein